MPRLQQEGLCHGEDRVQRHQVSQTVLQVHKMQLAADTEDMHDCGLSTVLPDTLTARVRI